MTTRERKKTKTDKKVKQQTKQSPSKNKNNNAKLQTILKERQKMTSLYPLLSTIVLGIIFGFALNKGRVFEPAVIIEQFQFKRFIMLKMFLAASGTSVISIYIASLLVPNHFNIAKSGYNGCNNLISTVIGASLLGIGMAVAGACPGMVLIQIGAGVPNSVITLIGGACGALIYGLIEPFIRSFIAEKNINKLFLDDLFGIDRSILSPLVGSVLLGIAFVFELLFPWKSELTNPLDDDCNLLQCKSWSPIFAGIIVGLLQIPSIIVLGKTIGSSSAYVCITGQWLRMLSQTKQDHFKHFQGKLNSYYQAVYVFSAIFGSMIAVIVSGSMNVMDLKTKSFDNINGNTLDGAFIGGFIMIFGARLGKGCTSGHGLSGMGLLSTASVIAVAMMFIMGAVAALILS